MRCCGMPAFSNPDYKPLGKATTRFFLIQGAMEFTSNVPRFPIHSPLEWIATYLSVSYFR